ncbi:MAG: tyrosine--tRNA ligase [Azonexus sp.]|nr:tyrosine--tRNA ligase [Azonexus sp.]
MYQSPLLQDLHERGLIAQLTDAGTLDQLLQKEKITLYCGFDPTADSLHLGHLVPVLILKRFQEAGHRPIALVGGATGMIGDPSFKASERKLNTPEVIAAWVDNIRAQVAPFLSFTGGNAALMANNHDWFGTINCLDFLRDIGKHFSVNAMIKREAVQQRLLREDQGISYTEFSYALLQGYDFAELYRRHHCLLQVGGSDQWGNITAGVDLARRLHQAQTYGLTVPLITKTDGTKFGKTESGAIWLDRQKTSPYAFYQFWLNTADADVYRFLKFFTFLPVARIAEIEAADQASSGKPEAQRILATEATRLVHGEAALLAARRITESLFSGQLADLTENDLEQLAQDGLSHIAIDRANSGLIEALTAAGLAKSKAEARTFIQGGGVTINGQPAPGLNHVIGDDERLYGRFTILRRGKKNYGLIRWRD